MYVGGCGAGGLGAGGAGFGGAGGAGRGAAGFGATGAGAGFAAPPLWDPDPALEGPAALFVAACLPASVLVFLLGELLSSWCAVSCEVADAGVVGCAVGVVAGLWLCVVAATGVVLGAGMEVTPSAAAVATAHAAIPTVPYRTGLIVHAWRQLVWSRAAVLLTPVRMRSRRGLVMVVLHEEVDTPVYCGQLASNQYFTTGSEGSRVMHTVRPEQEVPLRGGASDGSAASAV